MNIGDIGVLCLILDSIDSAFSNYNIKNIFKIFKFLRVLISFLSEFNSKSNILTEFLMKKADGKTPISLLKVFNATTLDVIASVIMHFFYNIF